jgi:hypothetical protein
VQGMKCCTFLPWQQISCFENARNAVVRCLQESFMQNKFTLMSRRVEKRIFCKRISVMESWPLWNNFNLYNLTKTVSIWTFVASPYVKACNSCQEMGEGDFFRTFFSTSEAVLVSFPELFLEFSQRKLRCHFHFYTCFHVSALHHHPI